MSDLYFTIDEGMLNIRSKDKVLKSLSMQDPKQAFAAAQEFIKNYQEPKPKPVTITVFGVTKRITPSHHYRKFGAVQVLLYTNQYGWTAHIQAQNINGYSSSAPDLDTAVANACRNFKANVAEQVHRQNNYMRNAAITLKKEQQALATVKALHAAIKDKC